MAAAIILAVRLLDPFGLDHALSEQAGQIVARLWSAGYPPALPRDARTGPGARDSAPAYARDQIIVLTLDEAYFRNEPGQRLSWPIPLERLAELLAHVRDAKPRMIFLDMILAQDRWGPAATANSAAGNSRAGGAGSDRPLSAGALAVSAQLRDANAHGTPVVLADLPASTGVRAVCGDSNLPAAPVAATATSDRPPQDAGIPETKAGQGKAGGGGPETGAVLNSFACAARHLAPVLWDADEGVYPARASDNRPTPAFLMHALLAARDTPHASTGDTHRADTRDGEGARGHGLEALQLVWNVGPMQPHPTCPYGATPLDWWQRVLFLARAIVPREGEFRDAGEQCLPATSMSAGELFDLGNAARAHAAIAGKIVLIGPGWETAPDMAATPFHGRIHGVFVHAMALDNLLSYGAHYPRAEAHHGDLAHMETWLAALIVGLGLGLARGCRALWPREIGDWRQLGISLALVGLLSWLASFHPDVSSSMPFVLPILVGIVEPLLMLGSGHLAGHDGSGHGGGGQDGGGDAMAGKHGAAG